MGNMGELGCAWFHADPAHLAAISTEMAAQFGGKPADVPRSWRSWRPPSCFGHPEVQRSDRIR